MIQKQIKFGSLKNFSVLSDGSLVKRAKGSFKFFSENDNQNHVLWSFQKKENLSKDKGKIAILAQKFKNIWI
jgi:hypothetical protein